VTFFCLRTCAMTAVFKFSQDKAIPDRIHARRHLLRKIAINHDQTMPYLADDLESVAW
jgi:hypothetical protein